jgi:hypothetical protein
MARDIPPTWRGYEFGEVASALQKSIRRGDEDAALYWAVELDQSGYGEYVWKRLRVVCSEDVGIAEPTMPATIAALYATWKELRKKRDDRQEPWRLMLCHAVILLARAKKSRLVDHALLVHYNAEDERRPVPDVARDKHTRSGRRKRRGWSHFFEQGTLLADPDTGELTEEGSIPDPYRERARAALCAPAVPGEGDSPQADDGGGERGGEIRQTGRIASDGEATNERSRA